MRVAPESDGVLESSSALRSLNRNRDFMLLWSGQVVSRIGSRVSTFAFPLLTLTLTHSALQAGLVTAANTVPSLILGLPAGVLVDRWNRKQVMLACDFGRAVVLASIPLTVLVGHLVVTQLFVVAAVEGILGIIFSLAATASLPRIVPPSQLSTAIARNEVLYPVGDLLGPPLAGVLFNGVRHALPFAVDALSYLASVAGLLGIRTNLQDIRPATVRDLWDELRVGIRWLWEQPVLCALAVLTSLGFLVDAAGTLVVIVMAEDLGASSTMVGVIFAISAVGGLIGLPLGPWLTRSRRVGSIILVTTWLLALGWLGTAVAPAPLLLGLAGAWCYLWFMLYEITETSFRLARIPDEFQGRVNSVFTLIAFGSYPLGAVMAGVLIQSMGARATALGLVACVVIQATTATLLRPVREAPLLVPENSG